MTVNVDDADHPTDYHIGAIAIPPGSHTLSPDEKALPEEEFSVETGGASGQIEGVAEGDEWMPSGIWGEPGTDTVWVVDPSHFGIHALKLSALKQGRIERHVAADTTEVDQRLNYSCHFSGSQASGIGNPSLTVMWGTGTTMVIANESSETLDLYSRDDASPFGCSTKLVTEWADDGQNYTTANEDFSSPFTFAGALDLSRGPQTIRGIWANATTGWISGPSHGLSPSGVYTFRLDNPREVAKATGYDGHGASWGLWSDGTTMWVATDTGWIRAYELGTGVRRAEFDIPIATYATPPGDIWSDGETIWVTNRIGRIDAYWLFGPKRLDEGDDCANAREYTECTIEVGGSFDGSMDGAYDTDWFRVNFDTGTTYDIRMFPDRTNGKAATACIAGVYDRDGEFLDKRGGIVPRQIWGFAYHTAAGGYKSVGGVAVTTFKAAYSGEHYISLCSAGEISRRGGDYRLGVRQLAYNDLINDDYLPGTFVGSVTLEESLDLFSQLDLDSPETSSVTGYIEDAGEFQYRPSPRVLREADRDWFRVELDAGVEYRVIMSSKSTSLPDPQIGGVYRGLGETSPTVDAPVDDIDAIRSHDSQLDFSVASTGPFYIEATVNESGGPFNVGQYRLSICELVDGACQTPGTSGTAGTSSTSKSAEPTSLRASFESAPKAHDGVNAFNVLLAFSDAVEISPEDLRDHALEVSGGAVTDAAKVDDRQDLWELTVQPAGSGPVVIRLLLGSETCTDPGALCTEDEELLAAAGVLSVPGPSHTAECDGGGAAHGELRPGAGGA